MNVTQTSGKWFVDCEPFEAGDETFDSYGPYDTKAAANECRRGVERFNKIVAKEERDERRK